MLTTGAIGTVLPSIKEDYGENKKIDVNFSPSHSLFLGGFPNAKMTGIYIDKNGNWKVQINLMASLTIETTPRNYEVARDIYMTAVFKMKVIVNETSPFTKKFSWIPKNIEITNLKVMNPDKDEKMDME